MKTPIHLHILYIIDLKGKKEAMKSLLERSNAQMMTQKYISDNVFFVLEREKKGR